MIFSKLSHSYGVKAFIRERFNVPVTLLSVMLLIYAVIVFSRLGAPGWMYVGDTLNSFAVYSYHYSGFASGEYPLWNPLVRGGEPHMVQQIIHDLANPIVSITTLFFVIIGVKNIVLAYTVILFSKILLYVIGIYLLVYAWTGNRYASAFASVISIASSTVFFYVYHVSFIVLLHAIPWILFAITMYFRKYEFRYLLLFALSCCAALYSYEVVMGASYLILLLVPAILLYANRLFALPEVLRKIPSWHWAALAGLLFLFALPALAIYWEYGEKILPISRVSNVSLTDSYDLSYQIKFERIYDENWYYFRFWEILFIGYMSSVHDLRQFVGPLAMPLVIAAIFSFDRLVWVVALSGFLICAFAANRYPVNYLYELPLFGMIRNSHFFLQFLIFSVIICSALGFHKLATSRSVLMVIAFSTATIYLIFTSLGLLFYFKEWVNKTENYDVLDILAASLVCATIIVFLLNKSSSFLPLKPTVKNTLLVYGSALLVVFFASSLFLKIGTTPINIHNNLVYLISALFMVFLLLSINLFSTEHFAASMLVFGLVSTLTIFAIVNNQPLLTGLMNKDFDLQGLKHKTDPRLKFSYNRPDNIQTMNLAFQKPAETDFGADEYSSYVTLKDNSYKTSLGEFGLASFPILKKTYKFTQLPGYEYVMRKKFFLFRKSYISDNEEDMAEFMRNPGLLAAMIEKGIAISDDISPGYSDISLGRFNAESAKNIPGGNDIEEPTVTVDDYKTNSITLTVSAKEPGLFVYTDSWDKNWRAWVDEKPVPVRKAFHTFKGVEISSGKHEVRFVFKSPITTYIIAMNTIFGISLLWLMSENFLRRRWKPDLTDNSA